MLAFGYPGRDPLTVIAQSAGSKTEADDLRESTVLFWLEELKDLDANTLIQATKDLCGAPGKWPPSTGDIRHRAVELDLGYLAPPKPGDAWQNVCDWAKGEPVQLTDDEKAAADRAGGIRELKFGENVAVTRAHFLRFYDELVKKRVMTRRAHPETRQLAEHNRPAPPKLPERTANLKDDPTPATKEQVKGFLSQLNGYDDTQWGDAENDRQREIRPAPDSTDRGVGEDATGTPVQHPEIE
jgi:hypothetical protein